MNDYTFEQYDNPSETRAWFERFLREHNGRDWRRTLKFSVSDLLAGNTPPYPNGETTRIFWYRIRYRGILIGYADAKIHPLFNGRKLISDMWIIPEFRKRGHFHCSFRALVEYTSAIGICIVVSKYHLYGYWFESFGFDWSCPVTPTRNPDKAALFLVTRDAYKDMMRFTIKYLGGGGYPCSERGRLLLAEVQQELESERSKALQTDGPVQ